MSFNYRTRRIHYWLAGIFVIPMLAIVLTGILLQVKKQVTWVQPPEKRGSVKVPTTELATIFESAQKDSKMGIQTWDDVERIDVRPKKGIAKVISKNGYEAQVDLGNGEVLQVEYRRSDFIESIHDGSFFAGDWTKLGVFLPTGIVLLILSLTGIWMFILPLRAKARKKKKLASTGRHLDD